VIEVTHAHPALLTDALVAGGDEIDQAAARAERALAAWQSFPPVVRSAYRAEARRLARRAAAALVELLEVASASQPKSSGANDAYNE
jgi:acyl-CoA reductase-like NAD-dependent aldehyde dehydrogenase